MMENYTEFLKEYLEGRRNISKKLYKFMSTTFRKVQKGRETWDEAIRKIGGVN